MAHFTALLQPARRLSLSDGAILLSNVEANCQLSLISFMRYYAQLLELDIIDISAKVCHNA